MVLAFLGVGPQGRTLSQVIRLWSWLLALLATTTPLQAADKPASSSAELAETSISVLGLAAGDNYAHGTALAKALRTVLSTSTEWQLEQGDFSLDVLTAALGCSDRPDETCLSLISQKTGLARFVWGWMEAQPKRVRVHLALWQDGRTERQTELEYSVALTDRFDDDLLRLAHKGLLDILGPLHFPVRVSSPISRGILVVDGVEAGRLENGKGLWP